MMIWKGLVLLGPRRRTAADGHLHLQSCTCTCSCVMCVLCDVWVLTVYMMCWVCVIVLLCIYIWVGELLCPFFFFLVFSELFSGVW